MFLSGQIGHWHQLHNWSNVEEQLFSFLMTAENNVLSTIRAGNSALMKIRAGSISPANFQNP